MGNPGFHEPIRRVNSLLSWRRRQRSRGKSKRFSPELELLESKVLPSAVATPTIAWTAGTSGDWSDFASWTDDHGIHRLPGPSDNVSIAPGITVDHYSGVDTVQSIQALGNLRIDGGTLTVTDGVSLQETALSLGPTANLVLAGTQSITGSGNVVFSSISPASQIKLTAGTTWTIGSDITVSGKTGSIGPAAAGNDFTVLNYGTVGDTVPEGSLGLIGGTWDNLGTIEAASGGTTTLNPGTLLNYASGTLTGGTWKVTSGGVLHIKVGPIQTNDATIDLDGTSAALLGVPGSSNLLAHLASNPGNLELLNGAMLTSDAPFTTSGTVDVGAGSTLNVGGTYTQTAGTTTIDGLVTSTTFTMNIDGGALFGDGTAYAIVNPPSAAPPTLHHLTVTASVTLSDLAQIFDGSPETVVATTTPAGLPVTITYNGSSTAPTHAGSYSVVATIDDPNYSGSATGTLVIARATPTVTVLPVSVTYDGLPHGTTGEVFGVGGVDLGPATISYSGSTGTPKDAGSYIATAAYAGSTDYGTDSATAPLTIARASASVVVTPVSVTYDGRTHGTIAVVLGVDGVPLGSATVSYSTADGGAPVNAGGYIATGSFPGNADYTSATGTGSISIARATPTVKALPVTVTYDGLPHGTSGEVFGVGGVDLGPAAMSYSGDGAPVDAGTYTATASFAGNTNYNRASSTATIDIGQATPALVSVTPVSVTYDAQPHGTTALVTGVGGVLLGSAAVTYSTESSSPPVDAGSYVATGAFPGNRDYTSASGTASITIAKATPTVTVMPLIVPAFDGQPHGTSGVVTGVGGVSLGIAVISYNTPEGTPPVDAGSYTATGKFAGNTDYTPASSTASITIGRAIPTKIEVHPVDITYDGHAHATTGEVFGVDGVDLGPASISYSGSADVPVNAGSYVATGSFAGSVDYAPASDSATIMIGKATPLVSVMPVDVAAYDGLAHGTTGAVTGVDGISLDVAVISYDTPDGSAPVHAGSYTATGSFAGDSNYTSATDTATISIGKAPSSVVVTSASVTYDGLAQGTSAEAFGVNGADLGPAAVSYAGDSAPVNVGSYTATGTFSGNSDYLGSSNTATITIRKATAEMVLSNLTQVYSGNPEAVTAATDPAGLAVSILYGGSPTAPTLPGSYPVTATVNDPNYQANGSGALVISQKATVTSAHNASFIEGQSGSFLITTANGFPVPTLAETGELPSGVTFTDNHNGTATLAGIPADNTEGTYLLQISASNAAGTSTMQAFALNVLTPGQFGNLIASELVLVENGKASATVLGSKSSVNLVSLTTGGSEPAALWVASYFGNPASQNPNITGGPSTTLLTPTGVGFNTLKFTTQQALVYVDVRVTGVDSGDQAAATAVFTFPGNAISANDVSAFTMQYWNGNSWQDVMSDGAGGQPPFKPIPQPGVDASGKPIWTITVLFDAKSTPAIGALKGTVFTIALPTLSTTTTTVVSPAQAVLLTRGGSDTAQGLASAATFASSSQLSLVLRVSTETEYTASRTAVGGGAAGDIIFASENDDSLPWWLRDVPWIQDLLRPESTPPARSAPAAPPRSSAAPHLFLPPAGASAAEEAEVVARDAVFTELGVAAPYAKLAQRSGENRSAAAAAEAPLTPSAALGLPLLAAAAGMLQPPGKRRHRLKSKRTARLRRPRQTPSSGPKNRLVGLTRLGYKPPLPRDCANRRGPMPVLGALLLAGIMMWPGANLAAPTPLPGDAPGPKLLAPVACPEEASQQAAPPAAPLPHEEPRQGPRWSEVWGLLGIDGFGYGERMGPNGHAYDPLFAINLDLNVGLLADQRLYLFAQTNFWGEKAGANTNANQGFLDYSKREWDLTAGLAWNVTGPVELRAFGYALNNLNRGVSVTRPSGYEDGIGVEGRWYLSSEDRYDVARRPFLAVGYMPAKGLIDADGNQFAPGLFAQAYLTCDLPAVRSYLYLDAEAITDNSLEGRLLTFDGGLAARPFLSLPALELRIGAADTYDVHVQQNNRTLVYGSARIVF
jgi:hypothetical protein